MFRTVKYWAIFLFGLQFSFVFSQQKLVDSLLVLLKNAKHDSTRVKRMVAVAEEYRDLGANKIALDFGNKAIDLATTIHFQKGLTLAYTAIGGVFVNEGDYPKALTYYLKALKIYEANNDKDNATIELANIGVIYYNLKDHNKALDYYNRALQLAEEFNNSGRKVVILGNIGNVYYDIDSLGTALEYQNKALQLAEKIGAKKSIARTLGNIGIIYAREKNYTKALEYYFNVLRIQKELGDMHSIALELNNIGEAYIIMKRFKEAFTYMTRAVAIADSIGEKSTLATGYAVLSDLYEQSNIPLPDSVGGRFLNMEEMRRLSKSYYISYIDVRDSIYSEENKKQLVEKEMTFAFEKREAVAKLEYDKQIELSQAEKKQQQLFLWLVGAVALAITVIAAVILRTLRITRKQKMLIEQQKHEVEKQKEIVDEKQKEILDSIRYAHRIQSALITNEKYISKSLTRLQNNS